MGITVTEKGKINTGQVFYIVLHLLRKHESTVERRGSKTGEVYLSCQWQPVKKQRKLCNIKKIKSFSTNCLTSSPPLLLQTLPLGSFDATVIIRKQALAQTLQIPHCLQPCGVSGKLFWALGNLKPGTSKELGQVPQNSY